MTVYLKIKALSKRKPLIERVAFDIDRPLATSKELVEYIVRHNVEDYNKKTVDAPLFQYLTTSELEDGEAAGKIGFHDRKNEKAQDAGKAVENALGCFDDGIFRLFINDEEAGFKDNISLKDNDEITFVRLAMLAGRLW